MSSPTKWSRIVPEEGRKKYLNIWWACRKNCINRQMWHKWTQYESLLNDSNCRVKEKNPFVLTTQSQLHARLHALDLRRQHSWGVQQVYYGSLTHLRTKTDTNTSQAPAHTIWAHEHTNMHSDKHPIDTHLNFCQDRFSYTRLPTYSRCTTWKWCRITPNIYYPREDYSESTSENVLLLIRQTFF